MALRLLALTGPAGAEPARVVDVTLSVEPGEILTLVGPSGAGKSTLLRLIAGLEAPAAGAVELDGRRLERLPVADRHLGLVTSDRPLQPNLDVAANVELPLRWQRLPAGERHRRVQAETGALGLRRLRRQRPGKLSAGKRQAAALARETARLPAAMLLDEPMAHVDAAERARLRGELGAYVRGLGVPALLATNDQTEAMAVGDHLAVMAGGGILQTGAPQAVYDDPATAFVAGFLGQPGAALVHGRVEVGARRAHVRVGDGAWPVEPATGPVRRLDGADVLVGARPEHVWLAGAREPGDVPGRVTHVEHLGSHARAHVAVDAQQRVLVDVRGRPPRVDARVRLATAAERLALFDPLDGRRRA